MIERSFAWAEARGLTRKNTVHGEDEARLVLHEHFSNSNEMGSMTHMEGSGQVEDCLCNLEQQPYWKKWIIRLWDVVGIFLYSPITQDADGALLPDEITPDEPNAVDEQVALKEAAAGKSRFLASSFN